MQDESIQQYIWLFKGREDAYGLGEGRVERKPLTPAMYVDHLEGKGTGLGVFPMLSGDKVWFAAIDLDEPDFDTAMEMQDYLPGQSWIEKSRSGNAHVWVFFKEPVEAWVARGILKYATEAVEKGSIEIFPKQDRLVRDDSLGNYINLCFFGDKRPILNGAPSNPPYDFDTFVDKAYANRSDPEDWRRRARWLGIDSPEARDNDSGDFGTRPYLHICAEHIIAERENNPIVEGHRAIVYFNLAKMLLNYEGFDRHEVEYYMNLVNDSSPDSIKGWEIDRIIDNAEKGQFMSTGCDDPLMSPYVHPDCPIANHRN